MIKNSKKQKKFIFLKLKNFNFWYLNLIEKFIKLRNDKKLFNCNLLHFETITILLINHQINIYLKILSEVLGESKNIIY